MVTTHFDLVSDPFWIHRDPKRDIFCLKYRLVRCLRALQRNALLIQHCYIPYGTPRLKKTIKKGKKGPFGPQKTLLGDPEVLGGQRVARKGRYQVKVCGEHESHPGGPIRGSWDQIWSPGALRGPQKGYFGPNRALLGPLWTQKGSDTRSKCVVTMSPTQRS